MIGRMFANQEGIGNRCGFILLALLSRSNFILFEKFCCHYFREFSEFDISILLFP